MPFLEAVRTQPREVLLSAGALTMLYAFDYTGTAYLTSYGTNPQGAALSRPVVLGMCVGSAVVFAISYWPAGSFLPELFRTRHRYTGVAMVPEQGSATAA